MRERYSISPALHIHFSQFISQFTWISIINCPFHLSKSRSKFYSIFFCNFLGFGFTNCCVWVVTAKLGELKAQLRAAEDDFVKALARNFTSRPFSVIFYYVLLFFIFNFSCLRIFLILLGFTAVVIFFLWLGWSR